MREPQNALARINVGYICLKKGIFGEAIEHLSRAIRLDNDKKATLYAHFYLGLVYLERDMFEDAQTFFQKTLALGPNLIEAYYELGRAYWFNGQRDEAVEDVEVGIRDEQVQSVGQALRGSADDGGSGRGAVASRAVTVPRDVRRDARRRASHRVAQLGRRISQSHHSRPRRSRCARGRTRPSDSIAVDSRRCSIPERRALARRRCSRRGRRTIRFPDCRGRSEHVLLAIAPDARRFREWIGPGAPEWGAAITFPESQRIVMQGRSAGADAGDPREVLRHELAHLALHEYLGDLPPRWFDEGYASFAAREWTREDALATNVALALRGTPTFDELDVEFDCGCDHGAERVRAGVSRRRRARIDSDTAHGLSRFFDDWQSEGPWTSRCARRTA